jgi:hypothetical protein
VLEFRRVSDCRECLAPSRTRRHRSEASVQLSAGTVKNGGATTGISRDSTLKQLCEAAKPWFRLANVRKQVFDPTGFNGSNSQLLGRQEGVRPVASRDTGGVAVHHSGARTVKSLMYFSTQPDI